MWQEARKQEKKVRSMIVDYRKRAERRREFYEKFKADPTQCIQLHGRPCKIYMDPAITTAADDSLMQWPGNKEIVIDRFDVRAHLDFIPDGGSRSGSVALDSDVENTGELNYERYRILVQNELTSVSEDKFLHQIHIEELYGSNTKEVKSSKHSGQPKAAIGYNYDTPVAPDPSYGYGDKPEARNEDESDDDDLDFDLLVNLNDLNTLQKMELNSSGTKYGMKDSDFMTYLTKDVKEREHLKLLKIQEQEKQHMSGRKARRERRAYKERQLSHRGDNLSPPSYATAKDDTDIISGLTRRSSSRSRSSESPERVTYITSFGTKSDGNTIFGPNLPNTYKRARAESPRKRNSRISRSRTKSRSKSPRRQRHKRTRRSRSSSSDRPKRYNRASRRRRRNSSSSSSSRSSSRRRRRSSSSRRRSSSDTRRKSYRERRQRRSSSRSSSRGRSKYKSRRSSSSDLESRGGSENVTTKSASKVRFRHKFPEEFLWCREWSRFEDAHTSRET